LQRACKELIQEEALNKFHLYRKNFSNAKMINFHKERLETCLMTIDNIGMNPIPDGCIVDCYDTAKRERIAEIARILEVA
jgi:hypothetical protein